MERFKNIDMSNTVKLHQYIISLADGKVVSNVEWNFEDDDYLIVEYSDKIQDAHKFVSPDLAMEVMDYLWDNGEEPFLGKGAILAFSSL